MDDKQLQIYQLLYQAYADEIKNLWQRSIFLASFMVLVWTGYGVLQFKFIEKGCQIDGTSYLIASLGLCGVIIILSLLWIAMAKGSKFVQEAHEKHIENFECNSMKMGRLFCSLDEKEKRLFCDLNVYELKLKDKLSKELFYNGALKAYRYSPSKINIALGWVSVLIASILILLHSFITLFYADKMAWYCILVGVVVAVIITLIVICFMCCLIQSHLKGGKTKN